MNYRKKRYWVLALLLIGIAYWVWLARAPHYEYVQHVLPANFNAYYQEKLAESAALNARPNNEEKLVRFAPKTGLAFLYIHGFTASRGEGEYVMDSLAELYQANTYYVRLPGHGTNKEDHASAKYSDYLTAGMDALLMAQQLGDTVVLVGVSMGGLISTWLTAQRPDLVDALVLSSPFYDYAPAAGNALKVPGALRLLRWAQGDERDMNRTDEWLKIIRDGYDDYWYPEQLMQSLQSLEDLRNFAANGNVYKKVSPPTLLMYYYKDEEHQDGAAKVSMMLDAYAQFESTQKQDPRNKLVAMPNGEHVMMSQYVICDQVPVFGEIKAFIGRLRGE
jgi:pimeloyl-ACP methyl ester carboxylesterase